MFFFFFFDDDAFVGRKAELTELRKRFDEGSFQFCAVYGRRRVGKTHLLHKWLNEAAVVGTVVVAFTAAEQSDAMNLADFSRQVLQYFPDEAKFIDAFADWQKAFDFLTEKGRTRRIVVLVDEFPYLAKSNPSILSILQRTIDLSWKNTALFLILCGSSMSFMKRQLLDSESPLYGRITMQLPIAPFDFFDAVGMLPKYESDEDAIIAYGAVGGIPHYLRMFASAADAREAIIRHLLSPTSALYEEPARLLQQELREPAFYNSIVTAVASGLTRPNEIADRVRVPANRLSPYMATLIELGILMREVPVGEVQGSRKGIYVIRDPLFRFWFRFVASARSNLENGLATRIYDQSIAPQMSGFLGPVFEQVCIEHMRRRSRDADSPWKYLQIGRWWGPDPIGQTEMEIDIVAPGVDDVWFGECKWTTAPIGFDVLQGLRHKASHLYGKLEKRYVLFAKAGFSDELVAHARTDSSILLITYGDLLAYAKTSAARS